ncbi:MAG TPA: SDR family NAD(P)-dependent oxidoreductase, partial [Spirochaetes bacterium]|nr:SDR family NAD(P)-dependent oxidoreductase [Spirochaetota bacterium]
MYDDLKAKTAFITGAGKKDGIGFAIAQKLATNGCAVVLSDLEAEIKQVRSLVDELKAGFGVNAFALELDVTDQASVSHAAEELAKTVSSVDILINNAGAALGVPSAVHTYDDEAWMKTIDINFHGTY